MYIGESNGQYYLQIEAKIVINFVNADVMLRCLAVDGDKNLEYFIFI